MMYDSSEDTMVAETLFSPTITNPLHRGSLLLHANPIKNSPIHDPGSSNPLPLFLPDHDDHEIKKDDEEGLDDHHQKVTQPMWAARKTSFKVGCYSSLYINVTFH